MNGFKEFGYSMKVFIISLTANLTILTLLYYIFNIRQFPPKYGRDFWVITTLILLAITFFTQKIVVVAYSYTPARKSIIIFSSLFCTFMIMLFSIDLLSRYPTKTKELANIEEVYNAKTTNVKIRNFDIIRNPMIYSLIVARKKTGSKYAQIVFAYPFQSKNQNIFYCLVFKKEIDQNSNEEDQKRQRDDLFVYAKDHVMNKYNFKKIKNFEYITKMSPEFRDLSGAIPEEIQNVVLLKPVTKSVEQKAKEERISLVTAILVVFFGYIVIFLLSKISSWK